MKKKKKRTVEYKIAGRDDVLTKGSQYVGSMPNYLPYHWERCPKENIGRTPSQLKKMYGFDSFTFRIPIRKKAKK